MSKLYRVFSVYIVKKYTTIHLNINPSSSIDNIYCYYECNVHIIFKNIQLSHLGCSGQISTHIDTFWDTIIHQIRDHLISFFIAASVEEVLKSTWNTIQVATMKKLMSLEGGCTSILEDGGELPLYWPPFLTFSNPIGSLFMPNSILLTPFLCRKKLFVSITFSSRDNWSIFSRDIWSIFSQKSVI